MLVTKHFFQFPALPYCYILLYYNILLYIIIYYFMYGLVPDVRRNIRLN